MNLSLIRSLTILNRSLSPQITTLRTFKSDLKIKWVRPVKIPSHKPEKSGDLSPPPVVDQSLYRLEFENSKELQTADDTVKKLFTLEYNPQRMSNFRYRCALMGTVKRHSYDESSLETRIAKWTGVIRAMQEVMERFPRNKRLKVNLNELIDKRKKVLKRLRKRDYKRFEWILEKLSIVYKPIPLDIHWVTRKDSLRKLTDKYCEDIKNERLSEYKAQLEEEKVGFLEEKVRTLEFIREEQKSCDVAVTITQEEIDDVKEQLNKLKLKREAVNNIE